MLNIRSRTRGVSKVFFTVIALAMSAVCLPSCSDKINEAPPAKKPPVPVAAAMAAKKNVPLQLKAIGNVEAYATVGIKSQVGGELFRVHFAEGQDVKRGDLLFTIDPRPYESSLKQDEAMVARDIAQLENARAELRRFSELVKDGYVPQQQYEQVRTAAEALEATVAASKAKVENARLQLKYCYIYSPITGRAGNLLLDQGNLIKANADDPMVVINQIQPIYVSFSAPEQNLADIRKYMAAGKLKINAFVSSDGTDPEEGELTFVDNMVDMATGTIKLKGTFENKEKRLLPGQFVNAALTLEVQSYVVVVPSQALQTGQKGQYVFVVAKNL